MENPAIVFLIIVFAGPVLRGLAKALTRLSEQAKRTADRRLAESAEEELPPWERALREALGEEIPPPKPAPPTTVREEEVIIRQVVEERIQQPPPRRPSAAERKRQRQLRRAQAELERIEAAAQPPVKHVQAVFKSSILGGPRLTTSELRNAFVWSEILRPPLALRERTGEFTR